MATLGQMTVWNLQLSEFVSLGSECSVVDKCLQQSSKIEIDTSKVHLESKEKAVLLRCRESQGRLLKDGDK